jgi:transcriptional regulator with XRE-family HTH domain
MRLSDRIRAARRNKGLSQAALASLLQVDRSAVGHWERGDGSAPSTSRLFALARVTKVCGEWLATGVGPMVAGGSPVAAASPLALSREEERLIRCYRTLASRARVALLELAESGSPLR